MSLTKYYHHPLSVHIQNTDISENSSTHATEMIYLCHHHPPINTPCRGTTNKLSWLPVADLVGSFPANHPWWEVSAPKNWKPFTGITQFESKRWEKHKVEKPFRLGMWEVPIPRSLLTEGTAGPQIPAAAELLQRLFLIPKIFASLWLTEASRKRSILNTPPRAITNKLKVCWHLICCSHLKLHLEVEQHKVKLPPKAASGAAFLLLIKVIIFQIKHCSEPSRCIMQTEIPIYPCNNS